MTTDSAMIPEPRLREDRMVGLEGWEEIRRLATDAHWSVSEIARRLEVDRKTVRKWLREPWKPYQWAALRKWMQPRVFRPGESSLRSPRLSGATEACMMAPGIHCAMIEDSGSHSRAR